MWDEVLHGRVRNFPILQLQQRERTDDAKPGANVIKLFMAVSYDFL